MHICIAMDVKDDINKWFPTCNFTDIRFLKNYLCSHYSLYFTLFTSTGAAIFKRNVSPWFPRRCHVRKVPPRKMVWCEPVKTLGWKGPVRKKKYSSALRKRSGYIFQIYISKYLISNTTNYWHNSNYWIKDFCMNNIRYICSYHFNIQNSGLKNFVSIGHFRRISISMKLYVITFLSKVVLLYDYSLNIFQNCLFKDN